jgi:hypothetical protein
MRLRVASLIALLIALAGPTMGQALAQNESSGQLVARSADHRIRSLAIAPEDLGPNWSVIPESVQEIDAGHTTYRYQPSDPLALFQARYRNDAAPESEAAFLVAQFQDRAQTDLALHEYLNYVIVGNLVPDVRWRWRIEEVANGDYGYRFGYCYRGEFTAGYLFANDTYLGGVLFRGVEADEETLLAQATHIAARQEALITFGPTSAQATR